jgi:hypothetical protein
MVLQSSLNPAVPSSDESFLQHYGTAGGGCTFRHYSFFTENL